MNPNPDISNFLYAKQYICGPEEFSVEGWINYKIFDDYYLCAHKELQVTQLCKKGFNITLLGFALNPYFTEDNEVEILERLISTSADVDQLLKSTDDLAGRWVLFVEKDGHRVVYLDCSGLRPIYYARDASEKLWIAAQPKFLVEKIGFHVSREAIDFMQSDGYTDRLEPWFPGDATPYSEVKRLITNHVLDLDTGTQSRFWPYKPVEKVKVKVAVKKGSEILCGILAAAHKRYKLGLPLTGGNDSRVLLSVSKDFAEEIFIYTLVYYDLTEENNEIAIPMKLCSDLGLDYRPIHCFEKPDEHFTKIYLENVDNAHEAWVDIVYGLYNQYPRERMALKGSSSEICRCVYYKNGVHPFQLSPAEVRKILKMGDSFLAKDAMNRWHEDVYQLERYGYRILDFLYWEHRLNSWQSMSQMEFDLAQDELTPFSHRGMVQIFFGVPLKYRIAPDFNLYRMIMRENWPAMLEYPFNPYYKNKRYSKLKGHLYNLKRRVFTFLGIRRRYGLEK
jgi:hypothetical protein